VIIAGLDTSLTSTGLVLIGTTPGLDWRIKLHRIESKAPTTGRDQKTGNTENPTLKQRKDRLTDNEDRIVARLTGVDLVVIESPSFGSVGSASRDLAGLWWRIVGRVDNLDIPVAEVSPSGRIKYALGTGVGDKDRVLAAVIKRYPDLDVTGNDIADALVLAAMGARWLGQPIEESLPANHIAAIDGAHWPQAVAA
jgi:crossover junction endodeoxyribonuclease RuvC